MKISIRTWEQTDAASLAFAYNIGSRRVLEKAGFQLEGIMKCNAVKNGQILDMALYGMIRPISELHYTHP